MLHSIIDMLESEEGLSGWQDREINRRSQQLYLNMDREESTHPVEARSYEAAILVNRRLVKEASSSARKRTVAVLPKTGSFDVVFSGEALDHFFNWFSTQASAGARYNRMTKAELGTMLAAPALGASPLTLWHNALIPYAV